MRSQRNTEKGFSLFATIVIVIIVGIIAVSGLRQTELTEVLSGNAIQRSRALHATEAGLIQGERDTTQGMDQRVFSSSDADSGIFAKDSLEKKWWRDADFSGATALASDAFPGVADPPVYVVEEIGNYLSDAGTGVVSLDRGGAAYGRKTDSGRELVLYRFQASGVGSSDSARAVVESLYVKTH